MDSFALTNGAVKLTDNSLATPAIVAMQNINVGLKQFALGANAAPSAYEFAGILGGGGTIAVKGNLDLNKSQVTSDVTIDQVDLPALQAYGQSALAGTLGAGKLSAKASLLTSFAANQFNLHVEPASFSVDNLALKAPGGKRRAAAAMDAVRRDDRAGRPRDPSRRAVSEVHGNGMRVLVRRERDGKLSLLSLLRSQGEAAPEAGRKGRPERRPGGASRVTVTRGRRGTPERSVRRGGSRGKTAAPAAPASPVWQYRIASIAINKAEVDSEDDVRSRPVKASLVPLNLAVKNFSSDFRKPIEVEIDGVLNRRGSFKFDGPIVIAPLKAVVKVNTRGGWTWRWRIPYLPKNLNATIKSALLTTTGVVNAASVRDNLRLSYRGNATIGNVRMLDKVTGDDFVRWNSLSFDKIDFGLGPGQPRLHVGAIALSDFYARIILNSNGKLNLNDITSNPSQSAEVVDAGAEWRVGRGGTGCR